MWLTSDQTLCFWQVFLCLCSQSYCPALCELINFHQENSHNNFQGNKRDNFHYSSSEIYFYLILFLFCSLWFILLEFQIRVKYFEVYTIDRIFLFYIVSLHPEPFLKTSCHSNQIHRSIVWPAVYWLNYETVRVIVEILKKLQDSEDNDLDIFQLQWSIYLFF